MNKKRFGYFFGYIIKNWQLIYKKNHFQYCMLFAISENYIIFNWFSHLKKKFDYLFKNQNRSFWVEKNLKPN